MGLRCEKCSGSVDANASHSAGFVTAINASGAGCSEEAGSIAWLTAHIPYKIDGMFGISLEGQNLLDHTQT